MADGTPFGYGPVIDGSNPVQVYDLLVRMALAAGYRRKPENGAWWLMTGHGGGITLGEVTESILTDHGVDLREPVPGEEQHG